MEKEVEYRLSVRSDLLYKFLDSLEKDGVLNPKVVDLYKCDGYEYWVVLFVKK